MREGGGNISSLRLMVARVYPVVYSVKTNSGRRWMSSRDWDKWNREQGDQVSVEQLYTRVQAEMMQQERETRSSSRRMRETELSKITDGEKLYDIFVDNDDPALYRYLIYS